MVLSVTRDDATTAGHCESFQTFELSVSSSPAAEAPEESAIGLEHLYPVIAAVTNNNVALVIDGHTPGELELALSRSLGPEAA